MVLPKTMRREKFFIFMKKEALSRLFTLATPGVARRDGEDEGSVSV